MERIIFTVTNNLNHDQRMIRICTSLSEAGYRITLVGVKDKMPLQTRPYRQRRLPLFFKKGFGFYAEYNIRLFFWLLFAPCDGLCCIDLDTMLPVWLNSRLRGKKRVYDAHEYFSQQKEVVTRPGVYRVWHWIERVFVPRFRHGYTVSAGIAAAFKNHYNVDHAVIRNVPLLKAAPPSRQKERTVLYQGAINEARGLEFLIPAMKLVNAKLLLYGDGNFMAQVKNLVATNNLQDKVLLQGKRLPEELDAITQQAYIGINLVENTGLNQYYSLANKFFDYLHNGLPQVTMDFPEYKRVNDEYEVAVLIGDMRTEHIAAAINSLLNDEALYNRLQQNCLEAREKLNWQNEQQKLISFYDTVFTPR